MSDRSVVNVAEYVAGSMDSDLRLNMVDATGAAVDLTGATSVKLVCQPVSGGTVTLVDGSLSGTPTDGVITVVAVAAALPDPAAGTVWYACVPRWVASGDTDPSYSRTEYRIGVRKFPR